MTGKEITSLVLTFCIGFLFGVFIYFSGWLQTFGESDVQTQAEANSFTIISEVYGGCMTNCPSFKIESDGTYRYLFTPAHGEEQIVRDGKLPRTLRSEIAQSVIISSLKNQSKRIEPSICNSYTDGIDVKYRITVNGKLYILDTCGTDINTDSRLWNALVKIWSYFETGEY